MENEMKIHCVKVGYLTVICICLNLVFSYPVKAVPVYPDSTVLLSGTTSALRPETAGPIIDQQTSAFSLVIEDKTVTGNVLLRVRRYQGFGLLFDYRIGSFDDQGLGLTINRLVTQTFYTNSYSEFPPVDADYRLDDAGDISPTTASLPLGNNIEFDFAYTPVHSGESSKWMFVADPNNDCFVYGDLGAYLLVSDLNNAHYKIKFGSYLSYIPIPAALPLFMSAVLGIFGLALKNRGQSSINR
jgi:hypothetical protein